MPKVALVKKGSLAPKSIKSTPGQPSITVDSSHNRSSIGGTLALQGKAGNKATKEMKAAKEEFAHAEGGSAAIINWLRGEAAKDKMTDLFAHYETLGPLQKQLAHFRFAGGGTPSLAKAKKHMTGFLGRSVNWHKFSDIVREINKENMKNYTASTGRDKAGLALAGGKGAVMGAIKGSEAALKIDGSLTGATKAIDGLTPASSMIGGLSSGLQVLNAVHNDSESLETSDRVVNAVSEGGGGLSDMASAGANSAIHVQKAMGVTAGVAATTAVGAASIAGGAAYMIGGAIGAYKSHKRANKLSEIEKNAPENSALRDAAGFGAGSQKINRTTHGLTALKGAAMIIGGGLLLASATTPVGWILLGVAGALGGAAALYKFFKKRSQKKEVVDRFLDVDAGIAELEAENPDQKHDRDKVRHQLMQKSGFRGLDQCYSQILADLAQTVYNKGVVGKDQPYIDLLQNLGLKPDHRKRTPKPEMIAKKLHN